MGRELQDSKAAMVELKNTQPVAKGGLGANNFIDAVVNIGGISTTKLGLASGVANLDSTGKLPVEYLPSGVIAASTLDGPTSIQVGQQVTFTITNYNDFISYTLEAISGTVSRSGTTITYTAPATPGAAGFIINGRRVALNAVEVKPATPSVTSPLDGVVNLGVSFTATSSAFAMITGSDTHQSSDWQIATDSLFTDIVTSVSNDTGNKTSWPVSGLAVNTTYYLRVRHKGTTYGYSDWSMAVILRTGAFSIAHNEEVVLADNNLGYLGYFGYSVAISQDGTRVVVGAPVADNMGAVYVYLRSGSFWALEQKIVNNDLTNGDRFGTVVDISAAGDLIAASSPSKSSVYLFNRTVVTWTQQQKIQVGSTRFGSALALSADGIRLAITDPRANTIDSGIVYVYKNTASVWSEEYSTDSGTLFASGDGFGQSLDITDDGSRLAVGCKQEFRQGYLDSGAIRVFSRSGTTWSYEGSAVAADRVNEDHFGSLVAITADGSRIISHAVKSGSAKIYVFIKSGANWIEESSFLSTASILSPSGLAINSDGTIIALTEAVYSRDYVFKRTGIWVTLEYQITPSIGGVGRTTNYFGQGVAIAGNNSRMIIGAWTAGNGKAFIFN